MRLRASPENERDTLRRLESGLECRQRVQEQGLTGLICLEESPRMHLTQ
jgi:hypothetical protein